MFLVNWKDFVLRLSFFCVYLQREGGRQKFTNPPKTC